MLSEAYAYYYAYQSLFQQTYKGNETAKGVPIYLSSQLRTSILKVVVLFSRFTIQIASDLNSCRNFTNR
jgi:uncharacterized membrane protein